MLKRMSFKYFVILFYFFQIPSITSQERLSVNPISFSLVLKTGQMNTKFLEVSNLDKSYISVKTEFDTNWIALYPSKFILLPSETKKVMVVFSLKNGITSKSQDRIVFRSKDGIEKSVQINVAGNSSELTPDIIDTVSVPKLKAKITSSKNKVVLTEGASDVISPPKEKPTPKSKVINQTSKVTDEKPKLNVPRKSKRPINNRKNISQNYKDLVDSLQVQIKLLEKKLSKSENEVSNLIAQIKNQDKRISDLLSNLTEDMISELRDLYSFSNKYFEEEIQNESIDLSWFGNRFSIIIDGQTGFLSGSIRLEEKGKAILKKVATIANTKGKYDKIMMVKGNTDSFPIRSTYKNKIPSNWELSALRAATVVRTLEEDLGVAGEKLSLSAYSRFRPIADNRTEKGRRKNRRIEVVVSFRTEEAELFVNSKENEK
jgi:chemotaxis protein MotB